MEDSYRNPLTKQKWRDCYFDLLIHLGKASLDFVVMYKGEVVAAVEAEYKEDFWSLMKKYVLHGHLANPQLLYLWFCFAINIPLLRPWLADLDSRCQFKEACLSWLFAVTNLPWIIGSLQCWIHEKRILDHGLSWLYCGERSYQSSLRRIEGSAIGKSHSPRNPGKPMTQSYPVQ